MEATAHARGIPVSAKKLRRLVDLVRGKRVTDALTMLQFMPQPSAVDLAKAVKSAAANLEYKSQYTLSQDELFIRTAFANDGPMSKRFKPRSRGRVSPILHRTSHITIVVENQEAARGA
jgi:large subunit ribosomal protein L22